MPEIVAETAERSRKCRWDVIISSLDCEKERLARKRGDQASSQLFRRASPQPFRAAPGPRGLRPPCDQRRQDAHDTVARHHRQHMFGPQRLQVTAAGTLALMPIISPRPRISSINVGEPDLEPFQPLAELQAESFTCCRNRPTARRRARRCPPPWRADCRHRSAMRAGDHAGGGFRRRKAGAHRKAAADPLATRMIVGVTPICI